MPLLTRESCSAPLGKATETPGLLLRGGAFRPCRRGPGELLPPGCGDDATWKQANLEKVMEGALRGGWISGVCLRGAALPQ